MFMNKKIKKNRPHIQYSKFIPLCTFILFCIVLYNEFRIDFSLMSDVAVHSTIVTVTGSLCLTSIVWYLKNSQAEKVAHIKADTFRVASQERLKYNKAMFELRKEYRYTDEDIESVESDSPMDDFENEALSSLNDSIDSAMDEATSSIDIQN